MQENPQGIFAFISHLQYCHVESLAFLLAKYMD